ALAVRARPRDHRDLARWLHAHAAALPADDVCGLRRADPGGLDEARESDPEPAVLGTLRALELAEALVVDQRQHAVERGLVLPDRKSTRLNSSHQIISYAVFCLKKKKKKKYKQTETAKQKDIQ